MAWYSGYVTTIKNYIYTANSRYPNKSDKWRHCWTSLVIARKLGIWVSTTMGLFKEVADAMGMGTASVQDFIADSKGIQGTFAGHWVWNRTWWGGYYSYKLYDYAEWANKMYGS